MGFQPQMVMTHRTFKLLLGVLVIGSAIDGMA